MSFEERNLPEKGELVIGTVKEIHEHGAYITLDEYDDLVAYLPRTEASTKWVRSIREVLKEGQKAVFKVIRVNRRKKHVDISLKRVLEIERRRKLLEWKKLQKSLKIMEIVASRLSKNPREVLSTIGRKLTSKFGTIYAALEEVAKKGREAIEDLELTDEEKKVIEEEAKRHIEIKRVKISGTLYLLSIKGDGIKAIKETLTSLGNMKKPEEVKIRIYTIGAPRYKIELTGLNYKDLEKTLANMLKIVESKAKQYELRTKFVRDRR